MSLALAGLFFWWTHGRNVLCALGRNKLCAASATRRSQRHENNTLNCIAIKYKSGKGWPSTLEESSLEESSLEESAARSTSESEEKTRFGGWTFAKIDHASKALRDIDFRRMQGMVPIAPCCHLVTKPKLSMLGAVVSLRSCREPMRSEFL